MKKLFPLAFLLCFSTGISAQYYLKGEIRDDKGNYLQNATILLSSTKKVYNSGSNGGFGILTSRVIDTLNISLTGYENLDTQINVNNYLRVQLKPKGHQGIKKSHLNSSSKAFSKNYESWTVQNESYSTLFENPFINASKTESLSFSANTNSASYSNTRRFLDINEKVPPDAVKIEEMLNYFNFNYKEPKNDSVFSLRSSYSACPWNTLHKLLILNICARKADFINTPPGNIVFLVDASGSMDLPNKLPLLKSGLRLLVKNMRPIDTISIVAYGGTVRIVAEALPGNRKDDIIKNVESLVPDGDTPGEEGLRLAYKVVRRHFIKDGNNRIILATDGDFNVGKTSEEDLERIVEEEKQAGIFLTCLGVGMRNFKDSKLSVLAQKGNGNFAYLDNEQEAEKVLLTEFTKTMYAVADNVYIDVKVNPKVVSEFRLLGYDNKKELAMDSSAKVEGGEIGSGNSIMAVIEIIPSLPGADDSLLAHIEVHYQLPGQSSGKLIRFDCRNKFLEPDQVDNSFNKAAILALFGMKLKGSPYTKDTPWKTVQELAEKSFEGNNPLDTNFLQLVYKAGKIYSKRKSRGERR